ncbi:tRNA pseudouridine(38-40) synthase TruA [Acetobacter oeni]|uniref:tRNA pseudouridine synthase A n=1 Tax=Acetobacter oeni TaxID=304077 RepID=A0A511XHR9_9PROT|nr:tRNA pseudouridine(38-40) synthase TruA [Acetobacter oeni]MBB3882567.1 tRNA pseudouridine38-40 synthase [Acetobacter oeni]NHO18623.1 tRNA pseudouridine(38-40) synthase TruA [Acetobacter oeni]GBR11978.1 tRNA pseudouridine synthase A [Acetobacter oeni LMG 21952]GEN62497.1 tRNA pseudouridine synthase A [Acetobacter oeni]
MSDGAAPGGIQRWAVKIEYDGTPFFGWQRQKNGLSVQELLEDAAARVAGGRVVPSITAGRTDARVHASGQVAHLDFPAELPLVERAVREGISFHMKPHPVAVLAAARVPLTWNARFSAVKRRYCYRILNRPARPALDVNRVWHVKFPMDLGAMREAAGHLLGTHDFTSFRATSCQAKHAVRTLERFEIVREGEVIAFYVEARSFLHHQVRNLVGTIQLVGCGKWSPERVRVALEARDRKEGGPTAPAEGLYLTTVDYDPDPFGGPESGV